MPPTIAVPVPSRRIATTTTSMASSASTRTSHLQKAWSSLYQQCSDAYISTANSNSSLLSREALLRIISMSTSSVDPAASSSVSSMSLATNTTDKMILAEQGAAASILTFSGPSADDASTDGPAVPDRIRYGEERIGAKMEPQIRRPTSMNTVMNDETPPFTVRPKQQQQQRESRLSSCTGCRWPSPSNSVDDDDEEDSSVVVKGLSVASCPSTEAMFDQDGWPTTTRSCLSIPAASSGAYIVKRCGLDPPSVILEDDDEGDPMKGRHRMLCNRNVCLWSALGIWVLGMAAFNAYWWWRSRMIMETASTQPPIVVLPNNDDALSQAPVAPSPMPSMAPTAQVQTTLSPTTSATAEPTAAPKLRILELRHILEMYAPDSLIRVEQDPVSSPQAKAWHWLTSTKAAREISSSSQINPQRILQRFVLATLYYSTNGDQWTHSEHWLDADTDECYWFSQQVGSACNVQGQLVYLDLSHNELRGLIPPEIRLLAPTLLVLNLSSNALTGAIPPEIFGGEQASWPALYEIDLSWNRLEGSLLTHQQQWSQVTPQLQTLSLAGNGALTGYILSQNTLPRYLKRIDLLHTSFTGSLKAWCEGKQGVDVTADCSELDCPCCRLCCATSAASSSNLAVLPRDVYPSCWTPKDGS